MDLIRYIQQGDTFAFEQTFLRWRAKVYAYFMHNTKNVYIAEELTQITFIKLWDYRSSLSADYSLETQIFRIARTSLIDYLRASARKRKLEQELIERKTDCLQPVESCNYISLALDKLPPVRKKVFLLSRMDGFSTKQIAWQLSISDRTVEKHISLALKQLRKILLLLFCLLSLCTCCFFAEATCY